MLSSVESWLGGDCEWTSATVGDGGEKVWASDGPIKGNEIADCVSELQSDAASHFSAGIPVACWRHRRGQTVSGTVFLDVECWAPDCKRYVYGDPAIEGNARVAISPANPFWLPSVEDSVGGSEEYLRRVIENVEALGYLLLTVVQKCRPRSLKLFVDHSWRFPHNAHLAYFECAEAVIEEVQFLERIWKNGSLYDDRPLGGSTMATDDLCLSAWRSVEQRRELWSSINELLKAKPAPTVDGILASLESTTCNVNHDGNGGFFIYGNEFFLNSFVDEFYLDVLRFTGNRSG